MGLAGAFYKAFSRNNAVYVGLIVVGALAGEKAVDAGFGSLWERNNQGKLFKHIATASDS